jgi:hypothetical protein
MGEQAPKPQGAPPNDEAEVRALYQRMLDGWNARDGDA